MIKKLRRRLFNQVRSYVPHYNGKNTKYYEAINASDIKFKHRKSTKNKRYINEKVKLVQILLLLKNTMLLIQMI
jgi:hypothetical protein